MVATAAHGPSRNPQSPAIRLNQGYDVDVDPAHIEATRTAFHIVCDSLQLECDMCNPITEIIVTKIIALAKAGEHNADRLVESSTIWQKTPRPNSPPVGTSPSRTARTGTSVGARAQ
jgi:hypothetical protein